MRHMTLCVWDADPLSLYSRINPEQNCVDLSDQGMGITDGSDCPSGVSYNDKVYGIQFPGTRVSACVYNKDIFADLGLEVPRTYEDFRQFARLLRILEDTSFMKPARMDGIRFCRCLKQVLTM